MSYEKNAKTSFLKKKKPLKVVKTKASSKHLDEYTDLELETINSTRYNFLIWRDLLSK